MWAKRGSWYKRTATANPASRSFRLPRYHGNEAMWHFHDVIGGSRGQRDQQLTIILMCVLYKSGLCLIHTVKYIFGAIWHIAIIVLERRKTHHNRTKQMNKNK